MFVQTIHLALAGALALSAGALTHTARAGALPPHLAKVTPKGVAGDFRHGEKCRAYYDTNKKLLGIWARNAAAPNTYAYSADVVHAGIDIPADQGSNVFPLADGVVHDVIASTSDAHWSSLGYMVMVKHDAKIDGKTTYSLYLHLDAPPPVRKGGSVREGTTVIGKVGQTGSAFGSGAHLHLEVRHFSDRLFKTWGNIYGFESTNHPDKTARYSASDFHENWVDPEDFAKLTAAATSNGESASKPRGKLSLDSDFESRRVDPGETVRITITLREDRKRAAGVVVGIDDPFIRACTLRTTDSDGEVTYETIAPSKSGTYSFQFFVDGKAIERARITVRK